MALWEFHLGCDDGTLTEQTILAEGEDEATALMSASSLIDQNKGMVFSTGKQVTPDEETRWREVCEDNFPVVVSDTGRFALYARGNTKSTQPPQNNFFGDRLWHEGYICRHWRGEFSLRHSFWVNSMLITGVSTVMLFSLLRMIQSPLQSHPPSLEILIAFSVALLVNTLTCCWSVVGTWRSARIYNLLGARIWTHLARATLMMGIFFTMMVTLRFVSAVTSSGITPGISATVCNGMTIDLMDIMVDGSERRHPISNLLHPGYCISVSNLEAGNNNIQFVEKDGEKVASCQREVSLISGGRITISSSDNSKCLF